MLLLYWSTMLHRICTALAAVSMFYGHEAASASTTGKAETLNCLAEMNEARTAAGLAQFEEASNDKQKLPQSTTLKEAINAGTLWNEICTIITTEESNSAEAEKLEGTFAYYPGKKDCKAAVQHWKDGFSLFNNQLPPTYTALNNPAVYTDRAVSFIALYNPKASPVASCAFVTCTTASEFAAPALSKGKEGPTLRSLGDGAQTTTAVICLTNPKALTTGAAPFKEDEWQKIVQSIVGTEEGNGVSPIFGGDAVEQINRNFKARDEDQESSKLPPTYTDSNQPDVYTDQAVSFVALYNPKANLVASCAFVTCTEGAEFAAPELSSRHEERTLRRLRGEEEPATSVICLANRKALNSGDAPFKVSALDGLVVGSLPEQIAEHARPKGFFWCFIIYVKDCRR
ncbi:SAG family member [Eimeria necatrix]|uniref:SAG family member n=1 Tax=Eimeria necatrix TaxID=51315 RepID=U6N497_9EIME|nr:SAG family member [Eimeria necatrix]CDJ70109.1 SAG family member [Eimeria necatrix]